jgi:hypothetical protein
LLSLVAVVVVPMDQAVEVVLVHYKQAHFLLIAVCHTP